ncbi:family 43 glycosylhydrolase [Pedobacter sp. SD-b]|uniref:Family 43 glycosylhydrolase n=1 Tax=Pedobacter segetis TaxID=2793069 RepID=A0ABS1BGX5_9SPHI|nr:family 43 glycosylhydrolase [Pedobacter segetis]MBK0382097.1 family 43 glycosylhydrolase [Pedobacter segetis]
MKKILTQLLLAVSFITGAFAQQKIEVNNEHPRTDTQGNIVDAHDGRVVQFGDTFYWYGTHYGDTNGFVHTNKYVVYSSKNLKTWKFEGDLFQSAPEGVYYRPHVIYNKKTHQYVMWYNWYPKLWNGQFGVAVSNSPTGPFNIINENAKVKHSDLGVGDLGLFVDDNQKAYLSYNTINGHSVSVEELDDDYTASKLIGSEFIAKDCEAGSMFKRDGIYYLLTDYTCCFCTQGSGARVYIAKNPLGPYTLSNNINRYPGEYAALLNDGFAKDNQYINLTQKSNEIELELNDFENISSLQIHQFTGDRKGQCGEVGNPKVHDPILDYGFEISYFEDGVWKKLIIRQKEILKTALSNTYQLSFDGIKTDKISIKPIFKNEAEVFHLSEISINQNSKNFRAYIKNNNGKPIIPAQQAYVMRVETKKGPQFIWMGDLWGSALDNVKGHDFQYWSAPLTFYKNGWIKPLEYTNQWKLKISK